MKQGASDTGLRWDHIGILALLSALTPLAVDLYLPAMPSIAHQLGSDLATVQLSLSVYLITFASFQLLFGPIADSWGRQQTIYLGLVLFAAGSVLCAKAPDVGVLLGGRFVQGIGGAAIAVSVPALLRDRLDGDDFARSFSLIMLTMTLAPLVAPLIGGWILSVAGWRPIFGLLVLVALIAGLGFRWRIGHQGSHQSITFRPIKSILAYAALLSHPGIRANVLSGAFGFAGMLCFLTASPGVYIEVFGVEAQHYGVLFGINILAMMVLTSLNARWVKRLGFHRTTRWGLIQQAIAALALLVISQWPAAPLVVLVFACALYISVLSVIGSGLLTGILQVSEEHSGSAAALMGASRFGGGAIAGVIVSAMHSDSHSAMALVMGVCGLGALLMYELGGLKQTQAN